MKRYLRLCGSCKHYKPHKPMSSPFVGGNWMGDGRCKEGVNGEYGYTTVESNSCEHHKEKEE